MRDREDFEGSPYPKDALMLEQNVLGDNLLGNHVGYPGGPPPTMQDFYCYCEIL